MQGVMGLVKEGLAGPYCLGGPHEVCRQVIPRRAPLLLWRLKRRPNWGVGVPTAIPGKHI